MDEQQLQQQIIQLVLSAMQGDQQANQQIQQIMQAALQGDQLATQIAQMIQAVAQQMQLQLVRAARFGAKLNYIRLLKGQCPEGYQMEYYKQGGQLCKRCMKQKGGEMEAPKTLKEQFKSAKCGSKMKKKENGGAIETEKCGGKPKLKKKLGGGPMKKANQKGSTAPSVDLRFPNATYKYYPVDGDKNTKYGIYEEYYEQPAPFYKNPAVIGRRIYKGTEYTPADTTYYEYPEAVKGVTRIPRIGYSVGGKRSGDFDALHRRYNQVIPGRNEVSPFFGK